MKSYEYIGSFIKRAEQHGMTAPEYAVALVRKHGTINGAAREAGCNRATIRHHLKVAGAVITTVTKVEVQA